MEVIVKRNVLLALCIAAAAAATAVDQAAWPFVVIRHTGTINKHPEVFEQLIDCHRRHRGACDEFWFAAGDSVKTLLAIARFARRSALRFRISRG